MGNMVNVGGGFLKGFESLEVAFERIWRVLLGLFGFEVVGFRVMEEEEEEEEADIVGGMDSMVATVVVASVEEAVAFTIVIREKTS